MFSRSGLGRSGMTETGKFFSPRNGIALVELWRAINDVDEDEAIRQELRFAFTAILPRASMRYQWSAKRPLNAQNQTYYIAPVYFEWNVFDLYGRKVNAVIRANDALFDDGDLFSTEKLRDVSYEIASAEKLAHLDDSSVDYVFTDPPFGSNIFYSDMNLFHEAWLGETTDHAREAVVHTTGKRKNGSGERYEELLRGAFSEAFRVLKTGRYMSVVFGNSSGRIWGLVQRALRDTGFKASPVHVATLDKGQRSVKGLNSGSEGVVTVDLIVTMQKPAKAEGTGKAATGPKSVVANKGYKRYLKAEKGAFAVDLDKARDEERFDGMWVLRTNTELTAVEVALRYKQLWMVEQIFRTAKSLLDTRPKIKTLHAFWPRVAEVGVSRSCLGPCAPQARAHPAPR